MKTLAAIYLLTVAFLMNTGAQSPEKLAAIWDSDHVTTAFPSDVRHADLKRMIDNLKKLGLKVDEVGQSNANREIYQVEFGRGPLKVFMWSQMHGDEPTATSALIDMLAYFQTHRDTDWVKKIEETITLRVVPMLNPDGAEAYQRRNLQNIDINRDALDLRTPEARLLKKLRDDWMPAIGFNLHNQGSLTTVGRSANQATISLLVVWGDEAKTTNDGLERNKRLASGMVVALQHFIPGHIAQYGDEWTPTAFGDNFSAWGTPVVLVETGALHGKDEMFLVKLNFVAFITALDSLATGSERNQSPQPYMSLVSNGSGGLCNYVFRRGSVVRDVANVAISTADIAVTTERRRASFSPLGLIRSIGDLNGLVGLEEFDASGFYVVQRLGRVNVGEVAEFLFYKKDRVVDWHSVDLEKQFPPDAIFSVGKWVKGKGVVPTIR